MANEAALMARLEALVEQRVYPGWGGYPEYDDWDWVLEEGDPLVLPDRVLARSGGYVRMGVKAGDPLPDDPRAADLQAVLGMLPWKEGLPVLVFDLLDTVAIALGLANRDADRTRQLSQKTGASRRYNYELKLWQIGYSRKVLETLPEVFGKDGYRLVGRLARRDFQIPATPMPMLEPEPAPPPVLVPGAGLEALLERLDRIEGLLQAPSTTHQATAAPATDPAAGMLRDMQGVLTSLAASIARIEQAVDGIEFVTDDEDEEGAPGGASGSAPGMDGVHLGQIQGELRTIAGDVKALRDEIRKAAGGTGAAFDPQEVAEAVGRQVVPRLTLLQDEVGRLAERQPVESPVRPGAGADGRQLDQVLQRLEQVRMLPLPAWEEARAGHSDPIVRYVQSAEWLTAMRQWLRTTIGGSAYRLVTNNSIVLLYSTAFESWLRRSIVQPLESDDEDARVRIYSQAYGSESQVFKQITPSTIIATRLLRIQLERYLRKQDLDPMLMWVLGNLAGSGIDLEKLEDRINEITMLRNQPAHTVVESGEDDIKRIRSLVLPYVTKVVTHPQR